jgi:peptidylprolyl isomerase
MSSRRRSFRLVVATGLVSLLALSACGGDDSKATDDPMMNGAEPEVSLPAAAPTELVITDITDGEGEGAKSGDTIYVNYVGVLSKDGTRFDGNYGKSPFAVTLGVGAVIEGWDTGLIGMKVGGRRQLDIPADLAYGDAGAGDTIKAGDALSFVIDAVAIIPATDPASKPDVTVEGAANVDAVQTDDLVDGEGTKVEAGMTVALHLVAFRADTGEEITGTWEQGAPITFELVDGGTLPGLIEGITGMKVGGRRQVRIPFADAWGKDGQPSIGLPPETDVVVVIDLLGAF